MKAPVPGFHHSPTLCNGILPRPVSIKAFIAEIPLKTNEESPLAVQLFAMYQDGQSLSHYAENV